jgi:hypothetical protein
VLLQPSGEVCPVERDALFFRLEKEVCENDESAVWKRSIPHLNYCPNLQEKRHPGGRSKSDSHR